MSKLKILIEVPEAISDSQVRFLKLQISRVLIDSFVGMEGSNVEIYRTDEEKIKGVSKLDLSISDDN